MGPLKISPVFLMLCIVLLAHCVPSIQSSRKDSQNRQTLITATVDRVLFAKNPTLVGPRRKNGTRIPSSLEDARRSPPLGENSRPTSIVQQLTLSPKKGTRPEDGFVRIEGTTFVIGSTTTPAPTARDTNVSSRRHSEPAKSDFHASPAYIRRCQRVNRHHVLQKLGCANVSIDVGGCVGGCESKLIPDKRLPLYVKDETVFYPHTNRYRCCHAVRYTYTTITFQCRPRGISAQSSTGVNHNVTVAVIANCRCRQCVPVKALYPNAVTDTQRKQRPE